MIYYSCFISCSPQVAPYAHLLQSCYRSNASTLLYPFSFEPFAIVSHQKSALLCGMYSFTLVVCLGFTTAPIIGMRLLVSIPFYGFNNIFVRLTSCRCPDLYAHPSWWHVSCASVLAFATSMSHSGFPAFLRLTERRLLAPVCCWLTSVPASTYLFPYPFSE